MVISRIWAVWLMAALTGTCFAGSIDRLRAFVTDAKTLQAEFDQTVTDATGKVVQQSTGTMQFSRPGKFRWEYQKPYQQLIVGDGQKLWLFDPDLNQATVRTLDKAIGSSPAALLAGDAEMEQNFNLKDIGAKNQLEWVEATPKSAESTFERVGMGFSAEGLAVLELKDNFGQTTVIKLRNPRINQNIAASEFSFTPPKGADVISN